MSDEKPNVIFQIANVGPGGIVAHTIENLNSRNAGIDDTLKDYYRRLARECRLTTLTVIELGALATDEVCAVDIYVQPDVRIIDDGKAWKAGAGIEKYSEPRRVPLLDCLTSTDLAMPRLVLTAPSGFGKSTAVNVRLQALVAQRVPLLMLRLPALRKSVSTSPGAPASDRVELALAKDIAAKTDPSTDATKLATILIDHLDASPGVILFDALDEVPQSERDDVVACVRTFLQERARKQTTHRVLITSRPYAYTEHSARFAKDNFRHIELAEFTHAQQDELIEKWFAQDDKSPATGDALVAQIRAARSGASADQAALAALMTEPMLLTYACMLAHTRAPAEGATDTAALPPTRHDLFDGVVSLMLEEWDPKRKHAAVEAFMSLFSRTTDKPSVLRQLLERAALEELRAQAPAFELKSTVLKGQSAFTKANAGGNFTRERLVYWLDEMMPDTMLVRARIVVDWLAQRCGLLHVTSDGNGTRYVLQAQLRDFLAVGGLQAEVGSDHQLVHAMLRLLRSQPQWYRPLASMTLARLRLQPLELAEAIIQILAPPDVANDKQPLDVIAKLNSMGATPEHAILHFVIAWANAFGASGPSCANDRAIVEALQQLRSRCRELVTAPAEGKPPIELRAEAADALGLIGDPRFDRERLHLPAERILSKEEEPIPGFVRIAAGEFMMGDEREEDHPQRKVRIENPFYIARYATTVEQFRHFVAEGGYDDAHWWDDDGLLWLSGEYDKRVHNKEFRARLRVRPLHERRAPASWAHQLQSPSRPVVSVSWFEARAYARWLDRSLHLALNDASLSGHTVQLPTEPQWERAARWAANEEGFDNRRWPWGDDKQGAALHGTVNRCLGRAASVGLFEPTGPTLFDMAGNASEWVDNAYSAVNDPRSDRESRRHHWWGSENRSLRGGSWRDPPEDALCSSCRRYHPANSFNYLGFRVVLSLAKMKPEH